MIRTSIITLVVLAVLGGAAYYFLGNRDGAAQAPSGQAAAASAVAGAPGEYWAKRCEKESSYCEIFQRLSIKENNKRLIEFAVGYPKNAGGAQAAIILPLGVTLTEGVAIKVDEQAPAIAKFRACGPDGCYVVLTLPDAFLQSMAAGTKMTVSFLDGAGKKVNVEMSLQGFGGKLRDLKA